MAEIRTAHTARKTHRCQNESTRCTRLIRPGDRYVLASLPPGSDLGNTTWWNLRSCAGCVEQLHGHTVDQAATERKRPHRRRPRRTAVQTVPSRPFRDEPRLARPVETVHVPALSA